MASAMSLQQERVWTERTKYDEAEYAYYARINNQEAHHTPLADEVARARQRLVELTDTFEEDNVPDFDAGALKFLEKKLVAFQSMFSTMEARIASLEARLAAVEVTGSAAPVCTKGRVMCPAAPQISVCEPPKPVAPTPAADDDDDVDLFGSDSDDDEAANKVREARVAAYAEKKSKKTAIIAKSSILLDVKPWDDTTDMNMMETKVREIVMDGLLWGAAKLVPLAYGIKKLTISCVVEDDKVSIDELQEQIEAYEDFVQSVDIAAFNKI